MQKVAGIGGVFFKSPDPAALARWYKEHLGLPVDEHKMAMFRWADRTAKDPEALTVWTVFDAATKYFSPGSASFMLNFIVEDLDAMRAQLIALGDAVDEKVDASEFGRFGWVVDPDGNRVELWEPPPA